MSSSEDVSSEEIEFLSLNDDAWYNVTVKLTGDILRVKYCGFVAEEDVFDVNNFRSYDEVKALKSRFRPVSLQLQDSDCSYTFNGMRVCASFSAEEDDVRFYDALIERVDYEEHYFKNKVEECFCYFILFWLHGPSAGNLSPALIADICRIQSGPLNNAAVTTFLERARESIAICSNGRFNSDEAFQLLNPKHNSEIKQERNFSQCENQTSKNGDHFEQKQDTCFGGMKYQHMILIENLDKGLSPSKIEEFLRRKTSISSQVDVFPSLCSDSFARGAIILDCKKNVEKLHTFLDNPDQIIVSSKARPLVVTGKVVTSHTFGESKRAFSPKSDDKSSKRAKVCKELKILNSGTKEYDIAKQMKELFMDFIGHQRKLQQRLAVEESRLKY